MDQPEMRDITTYRLDLEPNEVAAVVDALHSFVVERVSWCVWNRAWRDLDFPIMQSLTHSATQAYAKAMMVFRDSEPPNEPSDFTQMFTLTDDMWDMLATISSSTSWDQIERHNVCRCPRCTNPEKKMKHQNGCQCRLCKDLRAVVR